MHADKILSEARAKIIWGEPPSSVRSFLVSNGVSETVADSRIKECILERNREIKTIGIRSILIGGLIAGTAGGVLYWICTWIFPLGSARVYGAGGSTVIAVAVLLGALVLYGLWKLAKGIIYIVRPQSEHKAIPDIGVSDIIE